MRIRSYTVVFDAADLAVESTFWAGMLGGVVTQSDDDWCTVSVDGEPRIDVQLAADHVPPVWPGGPQQQQVHLDLQVENIRESHAAALTYGARVLQFADFDKPAGFAVYADPAGHPFCLCWGSG